MHHVNILLVALAASAILTPVSFWASTEQQSAEAMQELDAIERKYEAIGISFE